MISLINHSTYHRGQITMLMKEAGLETLNTDYIFYKRNKIKITLFSILGILKLRIRNS